MSKLTRDDIHRADVVGDVFKSVLLKSFKEAEKNMSLEWPKQPIVTQYLKKKKK